MSGSPLQTGASRMSGHGRAAQRGRARPLAGPHSSLLVQANHVTAIMLKPVDGVASLSLLLQDHKVKAFAIGPAAGIGESHQGQCPRRAGAAGPSTVLDADALTSFKD